MVGRYLLGLAVVGVGSGVVGAFFTLVLAGVEHLAFGFTTGTFAEAVVRVSAVHRFVAVAAAGVAVAVAWYLFRRYGPEIPSPSEIYKGKRISLWWMTADTTLQVVNVAAGASIGREGAPRQLGALYGARAAAVLGLDESLCRVLIAAGTGAGLAAIYNVPFGGTLFAIEVMVGFPALRKGWKPALNLILSTLAVAWMATVVARLTVPDRPTYTVDWSALDYRLILFAVVLGPVLGAAGYGFAMLMDRVRDRAPEGKAILWTMPVCYLLLAGLAVPLPLVLGNGHALAQSVYDKNVPLVTAALLIFAKPIATLLTVWAGATGGRLTPSLATGAAIGITLAGVCAGIWPVPGTAVAILASAAFLAGAMKAPITAGVLALEFTGAGPALWVLGGITIAGSWAGIFWLERFRSVRR